MSLQEESKGLNAKFFTFYSPSILRITPRVLPRPRVSVLVTVGMHLLGAHEDDFLCGRSENQSETAGHRRERAPTFAARRWGR